MKIVLLPQAFALRQKPRIVGVQSKRCPGLSDVAGTNVNGSVKNCDPWELAYEKLKSCFLRYSRTFPTLFGKFERHGQLLHI
jgi:hypothetical protein